MTKNYAELTNPFAFEDDVAVEIAAVPSDSLPGPISKDKWACLPEKLWNRILFLGQAYELHFSQVVEPIIDTVLQPKQCESLLDDIHFLQGISSDSALNGALEILASECSKVTNRLGMRLVISPP